MGDLITLLASDPAHSILFLYHANVGGPTTPKNRAYEKQFLLFYNGFLLRREVHTLRYNMQALCRHLPRIDVSNRKLFRYVWGIMPKAAKVSSAHRALITVKPRDLVVCTLLVDLLSEQGSLARPRSRDSSSSAWMVGSRRYPQMLHPAFQYPGSIYTKAN